MWFAEVSKHPVQKPGLDGTSASQIVQVHSLLSGVDSLVVFSPSSEVWYVRLISLSAARSAASLVLFVSWSAPGSIAIVSVGVSSRFALASFCSKTLGLFCRGAQTPDFYKGFTIGVA